MHRCCLPRSPGLQPAPLLRAPTCSDSTGSAVAVLVLTAYFVYRPSPQISGPSLPPSFQMNRNCTPNFWKGGGGGKKVISWGLANEYNVISWLLVAYLGRRTSSHVPEALLVFANKNAHSRNEKPEISKQTSNFSNLAQKTLVRFMLFLKICYVCKFSNI